MAIDDELFIEFELEVTQGSVFDDVSSRLLIVDVIDLIDGGSGRVAEDEWWGLMDGVLLVFGIEVIDGIGFDVAFARTGCCPFIRSDSNNLSLFVLVVVTWLVVAAAVPGIVEIV